MALTVLAEDVERLNTRQENISSTAESFFDEYSRIQEKIREAEEEYEETEKTYLKKKYLESATAEAAGESGDGSYIKRYFKINRDELQEIADRISSKKEGQSASGFSVEGDLGVFLYAGDRMWLRYEDDDARPSGLVVCNPASDIGFHEARAGMTINDMKSLFSGYEEKTIDFEGKTMYCLILKDDDFLYYYVADSKDGSSIIYIVMSERETGGEDIEKKYQK